jgi:hypothetical protein
MGKGEAIANMAILFGPLIVGLVSCYLTMLAWWAPHGFAASILALGGSLISFGSRPNFGVRTSGLSNRLRGPVHRHRFDTYPGRGDDTEPGLAW